MNTDMPIKEATDKDIEDMIKKSLHSGGGFLGIVCSPERNQCGCDDPNCQNGKAKKIEIFIKNLNSAQIAWALTDLIENADPQAKEVIMFGYGVMSFDGFGKNESN